MELNFKVKNSSYKPLVFKNLKQMYSQAKMDPNLQNNDDYEKINDIRPFKNNIKVCDISGRKPLYMDPNTSLYYRDVEEYRQLQCLDSLLINSYLAFRNGDDDDDDIY